MKKISLFIAFALCVSSASAQIKIEEPEFMNSYCILTSDSTYDVLPKENGTIGQHKNKTKSLLGKIGNIASAASAVGGLGAIVGLNTGNVSGALTGLKAAGTVAHVGNVASSLSSLAGIAGMDVIFAGKSSEYCHKADGADIRLLVKSKENDEDPAGIYRIVRFETSKKERRIQWLEIEPSLLQSAETKKKGYVFFSGHKYGEQSYLLTIPASEAEPGEYGIFFMNVATATAIPVATFSIQ